jgi:hypothetical protein
MRAAVAELKEGRRVEAKSAMPQRYRGGRKPKRPPGTARAETQRNFTDPDSRIMIGRDGFIQAYNAQAAVDGQRQIILAHRLSNNPDDHAALVPLVDGARANTVWVMGAVRHNACILQHCLRKQTLSQRDCGPL